MIFLDNQSSTPIDQVVLAKMIDSYQTSFANPHSLESMLGQQANQMIEEAKDQVLSYTQTSLSNEVIFTSGATEANNLAIIGTVQSAQLRKLTNKKRILVSQIEHKSIIEPTLYVTQFGYQQEYIPVNQEGIVDLEKFKSLLDDDVLLVSVMETNNEIGTIQPIQEIAVLCKDHQIILHVDACQSIYSSLDLVADEIDLLTISSHKMYGPKGIGALCINEFNELKPQPLLHGGSQQNGYRAGTLSTQLIVGFAAACEEMLKYRETEKLRLLSLRDHLLQGLLAINSTIKVNGCLTKRHPGNLNIQLPTMDAKQLITCLKLKVALSTGSACNQGFIEASHVLKALDLSMDEMRRSLRISMGRYTTLGEIDVLLGEFRGMTL
jgi:cysteine desulfurase